MNRYSRLLELEDITPNKFALLKSKKVLVIGVGGGGQHVTTYLLTNGVTNLTIVDFDKVELSNLNRQILLSENDVGKDKVEVAKKALLARNSEAHITSFNLKVDESNINDLIKGFDLVVDAVDNWQSKLLISKACHLAHIPFLHVGVDGYKGQCCLFINKSLEDVINDDIISSPKDGVLGPMVGLISSYASLMAIKYLLEEKVEIDTLYYFDYLSNRLVKMSI